MTRSISTFLTLVVLAGPGLLAPAPARAQNSADDSYDVALHERHVKAAEQEMKAAESFVDELMQRAAAQQLDLTGYVDDARYLANVDPPATPDLAAKLEEAHRSTLVNVENLLGLSGLFGTLHGGDPLPQAFIPLAAIPPGGPCDCSHLVFKAPHPGSSHRFFPFGPASVSPDPVSELTAAFSSGVIGAGHSVASTGESFTAPAGVRSVSASATMSLNSDIGVGGVGVAHGWSDVQFVVKDTSTGAEMCRSPALETGNLAAGAWYRRVMTDLGERTIGCSFVRSPGVAATYSAAIELRAYGTYAGLVGGHSMLHAKFKQIDVTLCP